MILIGAHNSLRGQRVNDLVETAHFTVEQAGEKDMPVLIRHRMCMFRDMGNYTEDEIRSAEVNYAEWLQPRLAGGELVAFIARCDDGTVTGSGCVWFRDEQPRPKIAGCTVPYLMSMYTEEKYRRIGVATAVLNRAIEFSRQKGYSRMVLHASVYGRNLYHKAGFQESNEMKMNL